MDLKMAFWSLFYSEYGWWPVFVVDPKTFWPKASTSPDGVPPSLPNPGTGWRTGQSEPGNVECGEVELLKVLEIGGSGVGKVVSLCKSAA